MKKTLRFFCMAALALAGAVLTGCSGSDDNITGKPQQPANTDNVVTVRTTVGLGDGSAQTRALNPETGEKTFAVGDKIAVRYTSGSEVVTVNSEALTAKDISNDGKNATFTVTLTNPQAGEVRYTYPAAFIGSDVFNDQDGTLASLQSKFDYAESPTGNMTVSGSDVTLPNLTLDNQLAILAIQLKDATGDNDITNTITNLTIKVGALYTYDLTTKSLSTIYVAINPTESVAIGITATDGTNKYAKTLTNKTYEKGNIYNLGWKMLKTKEVRYRWDFAWESDEDDYYVTIYYAEGEKWGTAISRHPENADAGWPSAINSRTITYNGKYGIKTLYMVDDNGNMTGSSDIEVLSNDLIYENKVYCLK